MIWKNCCRKMKEICWESISVGLKTAEKDSIEYQALYEGVEVLLKNKG